MKPVRITPRADQDIDECLAWIKKDNPVAARKFLDAVEITCNNLSHMPSLGSRRYTDITLVQGVRMVYVKDFENYLIFFLERESSIDIIRILHSARDIPEVLQS